MGVTVRDRGSERPSLSVAAIAVGLSLGLSLPSSAAMAAPLFDDFMATISKLPFFEGGERTGGKAAPSGRRTGQPAPRYNTFGPRTVGVDGVGFPPEAGPGTGDWIRVPPEPPPIRASTRAVPPAQEPPRRGNGQAVRLPPAAIMVPAPLPKPDVELAEAVIVEAGPMIGPAPMTVAGLPGAGLPGAGLPGSAASPPFEAVGAPSGPISAIASRPAASPAGNPAEPPNAVMVPAMAPPVALVGSPMVVGEIAERIPRRYGGRTLLDLMLLMLPIGCLAVAGISLGWGLSWYRDQRRTAARERAEARLRAARRRAAAMSPSLAVQVPLGDPPG